MRVSTSPDHEQLVSRGQSGRTKISWIAHSKVYNFRLYPASRPDQVIASVKVTRETESSQAFSRELAAEVMRGNAEAALSNFIAAIVPLFVNSGKFRDVFPALGAARLSCDTGAFLSTDSRYPELARNAVESPE